MVITDNLGKPGAGPWRSLTDKARRSVVNFK
jgi:hypothetical protein